MNIDFVKRSPAKLSLSEGGDPENLVKKKKTKRMRTTFTEEQIQILQVDARIVISIFFGLYMKVSARNQLQANFQIDSNPDGQDLERFFSFTSSLSSSSSSLSS